jgi:CBS domain-containing protein
MSAAYAETTGFAANVDLDGNLPVCEVMTTAAEVAALDVTLPCVPSVSARTTVREAAHLMAARGLRLVQVRNVGGELIGMLSTSDLYRWVAAGWSDG